MKEDSTKDSSNPNTCRLRSRFGPFLTKFFITFPFILFAGISIAVSAPPAPNALPQGGKVTQGSVNFNRSGNTLNVKQNSQNAVVNWNSFNVGAGAKVNFAQPNRQSIILNRASGGVSQIYGVITANGKVWIINPAGIWFGPSAHVDVAGLLATTANITDKDFNTGLQTGKFRFGPAPDGSSVVNEGTIVVRNAGIAALAAPNVVNNGKIEATMGTVVLAAGKTFAVDFNGDQLISFAVGTDKSKKSRVENNGMIMANGGKVVMTAAGASNVLDNSINMKGVVEAKSVGMKNGEIVLGGGDVQVSGKLIASGKNVGERGGKITIAGKKVLIAKQAKVDTSADLDGGVIIVDGGNEGQVLSSGELLAASDQAVGGQIKVLGNKVSLLDNGMVNASGAQGGGQIDIGQKTATSTEISKDTVVKADAITKGNGGKIIVNGGDLASIHGLFSAKGGAESGDGGFVETSGKQVDLGNIRVNTTAQNGKTGTWLIDPVNLTISSAPDSATNFNNVTLGTNLQSNNVNVLVDTSSGTESGNIDVLDPIQWLTGATTLTLTANQTSPTFGFGSITINGNGLVADMISSTNGSLVLNASQANINLQGGISLPNGSLTLNGNVLVSIPTVTQKGGTINVKNFNLASGIWNQVTSNPAAFNVTSNFQIGGGVFNNGARFIRSQALTGIGSAGSTTNPYILYDIYGVQGVGSDNTTTTFSYKLNNDIDASSTIAWNSNQGFLPIAFGSGSYGGTFDGNGFIIKNLYESRNGGSSALGLFATLAGGNVKNLGLQNVYINGLSGTTISGSLVGQARKSTGIPSFGSTITNVFATGTVTSVTGSVGGIVGDLGDASVVSNAFSNVFVSAPIAGGIVGNAGGNPGTGAQITNVVSIGPITSANGAAILGQAATNAPVITNAYYDTLTTGFTNVFGGVNTPTVINPVGSSFGAVTNNLALQATYTPGFDFNNVWGIQPNQSYPFLKTIVGTNPVIIRGTSAAKVGHKLASNGVNIDGLITYNGTTIANANLISGADSAFYFLERQSSMNTNVLVYRTGQAGNVVAKLPGTLGNYTSLSGTNGLNLTTNAVTIGPNGTTETYSNSDLFAAKGGLTDTDILYSNPTGLDLSVTTTKGFLVNKDLIDTTKIISYNLDGSITTTAGNITMYPVTVTAASPTIKMMPVGGLTTNINILGQLSLGANSITIYSGGSDNNITGDIIGTTPNINPQFTWTGGGNLDLFGNNSYPGDTLLTGNFGVLIMKSSGAGSAASNYSIPGSSAILLIVGDGIAATVGSISSINGQVQLGNNSSLTTGGTNISTSFSGAIRGGGKLIKVGTGDFSLFGFRQNSITAGVDVNGGRLIANDPTTIGYDPFSGPITVASGATLQLNFTGALANTKTINLSGNGAAGTTGALVTTDPNTIINSPIVILDNATIGSIGAGNYVQLGTSITSSNKNLIINLPGNGASLGLPTVNLGTGNLDVATSAALTINNITAGSVKLTSGGAISGNGINVPGIFQIVNSTGATFNGTVSAPIITLTDTTGDIVFNGNVIATTLNTTANPYGLQFNGGGTITDAVNFANTGVVVLGNDSGDILNFTNGVTVAVPSSLKLAGTTNAGGSGINISKPVTLTAVTNLANTGGNINLTGDFIDGAAYPLNLSSTTANTTFKIDNPTHNVNLDIAGLTVSGSGIGNTLSLSTDAASQIWNVSSPSGGTGIKGSVPFAFIGIQNLVGGINPDTFNISNTGVMGSIDGNTGGENTLSYAASTTLANVYLQYNSSQNVGSFSNIQNFIGNNTNSKLYGPNAAVTWSLAGTNAGTVSGINFTAFNNLVGGTNNDTFMFANGANITGNIIGGGGSLNTLNYQNYITGITATISNTYTGTITGIGGTFSGSIQQIIGTPQADTFYITTPTGTSVLFLNGVSGADVLNYSGYVGPVTINVLKSSATTIPILNNINQFIGNTNANNTIIAKNMTNNWVIDAANGGSLNVSTLFSGFGNLTGGTNSDTYMIKNGGSINGSIVDYTNNQNLLDYSDYSGNMNVTVTGLYKGTSTAIGSFTGIDLFNTGSGDNVFHIMTGGGLTSINGTAANSNTLDYSGYVGSMSVIPAGNVATGVNSFSNFNTFIGNNNGTILAPSLTNTWILEGNNSGTINGNIFFQQINNLTGGNGNDQFIFKDNATVTGSIFGAGGALNVLDFSDYTNGLNTTINNTYAGNVNSVLGSFSSFQKIIGGKGNDTFHVTTPTATSVLQLDGFQGSDTLNFNGYAASAVSINLLKKNATTIPVSMQNISNFVGNTNADNIIYSLNTSNNWVVNGNNSGTLNGGTFSGFGNLTGGTGSDYFTFAGTGNVSGIVRGNTGGGNTLDFTTYSQPVNVMITGNFGANGFTGTTSTATPPNPIGGQFYYFNTITPP